MSEKKKKLFPKLKKQIADFLADESGEITKKDALGMSAGVVVLSGIESVDAAHSNTWSPAIPAGPTGAKLMQNPVCAHVSGVVNGHISQTPQVVSADRTYTHGSHSAY